MEITTSHFGKLQFSSDAIIHFPLGLLGLEGCHAWMLLSDEENELVAWLQSIDWPEIAMAVVSPERFVSDCTFRVPRRELEPLHLKNLLDAQILAIVGKNDENICLNLKAPIVINMEEQRGHQVVTNGSLPLRYQLDAEDAKALRRTA